MISEQNHSFEKRLRTPGSVNLGVWITVILFCNAAGTAILVAIGGAALDVPVHRLWVPYAMLFDCGLVLAPSLYWARVSRERPKTCAIRFAIAMFLYIQSVMLALGFSTIRLGILSQAEVVYRYTPFMEAFSVTASTLIYAVSRRILKAPQSSSA